MELKWNSADKRLFLQEDISYFFFEKDLKNREYA
jgi:hypothetical protein